MSHRQLDLFNQPSFGGLIRDIKSSLNQAVRDSGLSRDHALDRINDLAKRHGVRLNNGNARELSKDTFEKWLNVEDEGRVPSVLALTVVCAALGVTEPLAAQARLLGCRVIGCDDVRLLTWARAYHQAKGLKRRMRELEAEL